jgi:hypothetical protein
VTEPESSSPTELESNLESPGFLSLYSTHSPYKSHRLPPFCPFSISSCFWPRRVLVAPPNPRSRCELQFNAYVIPLPP